LRARARRGFWASTATLHGCFLNLENLIRAEAERQRRPSAHPTGKTGALIAARLDGKRFRMLAKSMKRRIVMARNDHDHDEGIVPACPHCSAPMEWADYLETEEGFVSDFICMNCCPLPA
jgi:hypothetical protein